MPSPYVYTMSRAEMLAGLRSLREPGPLVADRDGDDVEPAELSDELLRELAKLVPWRQLLPQG